MDGLPREVLLEGPLTIRHISRIKDTLDSAFLEGADLSIAVPEECDVDISFVQLLASTQLGARNAGRAVRLSQPPAGALLDVLARGGFLETGLNEMWTGREDAA